LLFSLPVYLGFELEDSDFQNIIEKLVLAFFLLDILINFRTGHFDDVGNVVAPFQCVHQRRAIDCIPPLLLSQVMLNKPVALRYLKGWFAVDVISTVPVDWIDWGGAAGSASGTQVTADRW
jgi:hypothetical protein